MRRALLLPVAALFTLLTSSAPAAAEDDPMTAQAQALFAEGRTALEKGQWEKACTKFKQSLGLVKRASTLLNLGQCEQELGHLVSSARYWREGIAKLPVGDERIAPSQDRAKAIERRLPHLTVVLSAPGPAGTKIEVDGNVVPAAELAKSIPVDPGRHTVVVLVPGSADQRSTIDLGETESRTVTLSVTGTIVVPIQEKETPKPRSGLRTAGFVLLGVGGVGAVIAVATGVVLMSRNSSINADCPNKVCSADGRSLINGVGPLNIVNGVGWGLGIAGVAAGATLVAVGSKTQATVTPTALPGGGGVWMTARF